MLFKEILEKEVIPEDCKEDYNVINVPYLIRNLSFISAGQDIKQNHT